MELNVGQNVKAQLEADLKLETNAVAMYNKAVQIARDAADDQSRELFSKLLKDEEQHVDWLEAQLHQIKEMGYERYLSNQTEGSEGLSRPASCPSGGRRSGTQDCGPEAATPFATPSRVPDRPLTSASASAESFCSMRCIRASYFSSSFFCCMSRRSSPTFSTNSVRIEAMFEGTLSATRLSSHSSTRLVASGAGSLPVSSSSTNLVPG